MPMLGKTTNAARNFLGSNAGKAMLQAASAFIPGNPYGYVMAQQARDRKEAEKEQMLSAYGTLARSMSQLDPQIEGANELVAGANETAGRLGMNPLLAQDPRALGFTGSPDQMNALMQFVGSGGGIDAVNDLQGLLRPKPPAVKGFLPGDGTLITIDEEGNQNVVYQSKPMQALTEAKIGATNAQGQAATTRANAAVINANRPRASGGGARAGVGPSIDQPWTLFKQ